MTSHILYEQPLNERIRILLRLEHLFSQVSHFRHGQSIWDSHASIEAFIEILGILDRSDIRSEILKELEKHTLAFSKLLDTPTVDRSRLENTLDELHLQAQKIQLTPTKLCVEIRENDLLNSVRQRAAITGGTCSFDIPAYHYWLNQPHHAKDECMARWLTDILPLQKGLELLLALTRNSSFFDRETATMGFFQKTLDAQYPCQLLRIALPSNTNVYPEISGNKHRVNIRFMAYTEFGKPKQIGYNLEFDINCCMV